MPLTERAALALEESIAHWERNVAAERVQKAHVYAEHCALCREFIGDEDFGYCLECPVSARTGATLCDGSPWKAAETAWAAWAAWAAWGVDETSDRFREAAQAELDFLKSLRDPPASPETAPSEALK